MNQAISYPSLLSDIANGLEDNSLSIEDAILRLRGAASDSAEALDDFEIDHDIDLSSKSGPGLISALFSGRKPETDVLEDPVERALLDAIRQRDRLSALKIAGDTPGSADKEGYTKALATLRDTLVSHLPNKGNS